MDKKPLFGASWRGSSRESDPRSNDSEPVLCHSRDGAPASPDGLAGLHLFLFRSAGPAGPFRGTPEELKAKTDYFFPRQIWKDIVGMAVVFACICALAFWEPVVLLEEATPDPGDYHPEPEWYFLFLFQHLRLKMFSGELDSSSAR